MQDETQLATSIDRLMPERLHRLRRVTGVPVAFGGTTVPASTGNLLVVSRLMGTAGSGLRGLTVPPGSGLGGRVLKLAKPQRVDDYASTTTITHDYDRVVLDQEMLTSIVAVPVTVLGAVRAVLYAAVRTDQPIGDRAMRLATVVADQLALDVTEDLQGAPADRDCADPAETAVDDLARIVQETADPALRARLQAIHRTLSGAATAPAPGWVALAPRELDALRRVERGESNAEIAARLGLSPETVKAYLRTAMRKLDVGNRTAAVHAARKAGVL